MLFYYTDFIEISYLHETEYKNERNRSYLEVLDNLDEYVYATDIETDELVYMNRKLLEVVWITVHR